MSCSLLYSSHRSHPTTDREDDSLWDLYFPLRLSYSVWYATVVLPVAQPLGTDQLFAMDAHVLTSIFKGDETEALATPTERAALISTKSS